MSEGNTLENLNIIRNLFQIRRLFPLLFVMVFYLSLAHLFGLNPWSKVADIEKQKIEISNVIDNLQENQITYGRIINSEMEFKGVSIFVFASSNPLIKIFLLTCMLIPILLYLPNLIRIIVDMLTKKDATSTASIERDNVINEITDIVFVLIFLILLFSLNGFAIVYEFLKLFEFTSFVLLVFFVILVIYINDLRIRCGRVL